MNGKKLNISILLLGAMLVTTNPAVMRQAMRGNLVDYLTAMNHIYRPEWFHWLVADKLRQVVDEETKRLIVCMPPRHGKSEMCSKGFPPWYLGIKNSVPRSIIASSYSAKLATSFGRVARNATRHPYYSLAFDTTLDKNIGTAAADWALANGNSYYAAGVGGGITGLGADIFLIDDPIKNRKQADSAVYREDLKDWYKEVALTRLTPNGAVVIIMTRWHYDDLVGWLLREFPEETWDVVLLPAIQTEHDLSSRPYDPREPGEVLWPNKFTKDIVDNIQETLGSMAFNCLYQQDPRVLGGKVLDINHFVVDYTLSRLPEFIRTVTSWDTAFEETKTADYSVGTVWGDTGKDIYLLDIIRGRWRFPALKKKMTLAQERWNSDAVLIESKASGKDLLYELQDTTDLPLIPVNPVIDKVNRAAAISGRMEAGRVHVPESAPWLRVFLTELEHFPEVDHDDQVDSFTQAIRWMTKYSGSVAA